ncbi:hypothetical protein RFI_20522, partial [Reticulomyxa filosa]
KFFFFFFFFTFLFFYWGKKKKIIGELSKLTWKCFMDYEADILMDLQNDEITLLTLQSFRDAGTSKQAIVMTDEKVEDCKRVWNYELVQKVFLEQRYQIGVCDSLLYFMKHIDRLLASSNDLRWNINDRLLNRSIVSSWLQFRFDMNVVYNHVRLCGGCCYLYLYMLVHVCGGRSEIKKWIRFGAESNVIIWIVSLISFLELTPEENQNGMVAALNTFASTVNKTELTKGKLWLVLFNRVDGLEDALQSKNFLSVFPDYNANPLDAKEIIFFVMNKFKDAIPSQVHKETMFIFDSISLIDCVQLKHWIERIWPIIHKFLKTLHTVDS